MGYECKVHEEHKGKEAGKLIDAIDKAARSYSWKTIYKVFPGTNSNTFTAWIVRRVPEPEPPFSAIGRGYVE